MKTDILIIGGGPAGIVAAVTAKKSYPSKKITLVRKEEKTIIPCGIPYIFCRLDSVDKNIMSDQPLLDNGIDLIIGGIIEIRPDKKEVTLDDGCTYNFEKLILALGSEPKLIPIPGAEKEGVWMVKKNYKYLKKFREAVLKSKNIVIVGGGFIGVEFAEELAAIKDLKVSIIEKLQHCLISNFDEDFAVVAEEKLKEKGVDILTGKTIKSICGNKKVEYVELDDGRKLSADLVILSSGTRPNTKIAKEAGIVTEEESGIIVDEYLRTSISDIFAVGDCAQTKDFITGKVFPIMLASAATTEARIAASNLYQIRLIRENKGTVGVFSTSIGGLTMGAAGLIEKRAKEEKFDYITGEAEAPNRHPASLPGSEKIKVKLIFSKSSENLLLGGEIMGPESVGEMLNILALAISQRTSLFDFNTWQIATHPLLTPAPTTYPIICAAQNAMLKINK